MMLLKSLNLLPPFSPPVILLKFNPPGGPLRPASPPIDGAPGRCNPPGAEGGMPIDPKLGRPARRAARDSGPLAGPGMLLLAPKPGPAAELEPEAEPTPEAAPAPPALPSAWDRRRAPIDVALGFGPREGAPGVEGAPWREAATWLYQL